MPKFKPALESLSRSGELGDFFYTTLGYFFFFFFCILIFFLGGIEGDFFILSHSFFPKNFLPSWIYLMVRPLVKHLKVIQTMHSHSEQELCYYSLL